MQAGGLQVDGSLGGFLDVLAGATLSGTGTLGSVDNAGTISPGGSIGTLTLTGDYVHRDGATYRVDIDADGNSDLLDIAGSATIEGGDVQVAGVPGQYGGVTRYTIVDADGGVSGTYDALSDSLLFLDLVLAYDPNHVYLDVLRNDTAFGSLCGTGSFNQCEVAKTLDSFDPITPPTVRHRQDGGAGHHARCPRRTGCVRSALGRSPSVSGRHRARRPRAVRTDRDPPNGRTPRSDRRRPSAWRCLGADLRCEQ